MKEKYHLWVLPIINILALISCATYNGSLNPSVPVSEQAMLQIGGGLILMEINGDPVPHFYRVGDGSRKIMFPAGEHTFKFNYDRSGSSARGLISTGTFIAGNTYEAKIEFISGGRVRVPIVLIKEDAPKSSFTVTENQYVNGFAFSSTAAGFFSAYTLGMVTENEKRMTAWNIELGLHTLGVDLVDSEGYVSIDSHIGANYEHYFNRTGNVGISIGGGAVFPFFGYHEIPVHPYLRIGIPLRIRNGSKINIFCSYFFRDIFPEEKARTEDRYGNEYWAINRFGFGVTFAF